jgi:CDP-diacylglycerol---glycerol-3-phosphate 3-phosphatidyltransferase
MNLPNKLTVLRLVLVPVFIVFTVTDNLWTRIFALFIFIGASLTDLYDGYLARKYKEITLFGQFMDPLADKFLIAAAFISFVEMRELNVPAWMVVLIIGREFLITGLRLVAISKGLVLPAERAGKFKMTSQVVAVVSILIILCVNSWLHRYHHLTPIELLSDTGWSFWGGSFLAWASYWLTFIVTLFTLISGLSYLYRHRDLLTESSK